MNIASASRLPSRAIASSISWLCGFHLGRSTPVLVAALAIGLASGPTVARPIAANRLTTMRGKISADTDRNIGLLRRLVDQNSGTLNLAGVKSVGEIVRAELEPLGFKVRWEDMRATGRAGHLVATHVGRPGAKRILLIGHLDTVFEPTSAFQKFARMGNRATGPGVGDDKGGIVVIVAALRAMQAAGTLRSANVTVYLTGDEERTGLPLAASRGGLVDAGKASDVALEYEGLASLNGKDFATVARRSASTWELRVTASGGHSSQIFGARGGYGAIYELSRILAEFSTALREPYATFNVGVAVGGTTADLDRDGFAASASGKSNAIPNMAIARGDLRTLSADQDSRIRARMLEIVTRNFPGTSARLEFFDDKPAMAPSARNRAVLALMNVVNRQAGLSEMTEIDPGERGAADSGFVADLIPTLAGLGAAGGGSHGTSEWLDLDSIQRQALRSALLISTLAAMPRLAVPSVSQ